MVRLPFAEQAVIDERKLTDYLLNATHPQGHSKSRFFTHVGFDREDPEIFRQALLQLARTSDMLESISAYGTKFIGQGTLHIPSVANVQVTTVWILVDGAPPPRFVTAYPA